MLTRSLRSTESGFASHATTRTLSLALRHALDPRLVAARDVRLDSWWGRLTDGADFHLLIGKRLGVFGSENDAEKQMTLQELSTLAAQTDTLLKDGGFVETASLVFQLEAQY